MSGEESLNDQLKFEDDVFILTGGFPSKSFTRRSVEMLARAAHMLTQTPEGISGECLSYGSTQGAFTYRKELAKFLTEQYMSQDPILGENIQVTAGATQGLHFTASEFLVAGDVVFVEDPTYFIAIKIFSEDLGMKVVAVRTDEEGLDVSHLEELVKEHIDFGKPVSERRPFRSMVYTVPTFNNPTSRSMSPARCHHLLEVARCHDLLVFCDDVYNMLRYSSDDVLSKRLLAYEIEQYGKTEGNIISNGTFSKIMGPGLRVGWIEASCSIIDRLQKSNIAWSGGSFNHYGSQLMTMALKDSFQQKMIQDMIEAHRARIQAVTKILKDELPSSVKFQLPQGGYFYWLELPHDVNIDEIAAVAQKDKVNFLKGSSCSPSGSFANCIRISFSYYEEEKLVRGVRLLCKAINEVMNK